MALTDKDCVVFLGKEASKDYRNNFKDVFSKYGIHIGFRGTKAWIYCEKITWNKKSYFEFHQALLHLYELLDMNLSRIKESINLGIVKGEQIPDLPESEFIPESVLLRFQQVEQEEV